MLPCFIELEKDAKANASSLGYLFGLSKVDQVGLSLAYQLYHLAPKSAPEFQKRDKALAYAFINLGPATI